jgi:hypothetical protein
VQQTLREESLAKSRTIEQLKERHQYETGQQELMALDQSNILHVDEDSVMVADVVSII